MFTELHIIQNFAPSNLNRDDTGQPKDCLFGGVRRARISSQCLKRAIRLSPRFTAATAVSNAVRTKYIVQQLLTKFSPERRDETEGILLALVTLQTSEQPPKRFLSQPDKKDPNKTAVLVYLSDQEAELIASRVNENWSQLVARDGNKALKAIAKDLTALMKGRTSAPDLALFGRMLADNPALKVDAACQVAHALSTHRITMEMDFFTSVDDLQRDDTSGAGMMGFTGFNSACFYRYARIDWEQLLVNLNGDAELALRTVEGFIQAMIDAVPTGKQNSSAANNPPSAVLAVVRREGMAWSLANAFETPVRAGDGGYVVPSLQRLEEYYSRLAAVYGDESVEGLSLLSLEPGMEWKALAHAVAPSRAAFIAATMAAVRRAAGAEGAA